MILVFKCIKDVFKHFTRSYGAWISIGLISSHLALTFTFVFVEIAKINGYILIKLINDSI